MQIRFADRLPDGDFALVIPAAGADVESIRSRGGQLAEAIAGQRFDGEAGSIAEHFQDGRRVLVVGTGKNGNAGGAAEKIGGNTAAKLLTSGVRHAVIDLTGLGFDADAAAKVGLGAALRSWRYDRYRTRLKDQQTPTLEEITDVGGGGGAEHR